MKNQIKKIDLRFRQERVKLFAPHLYRTGYAVYERAGYKFEIMRQRYIGWKKKGYYHILVSKDADYDNVYRNTLGEVKEVIWDIEKYALTNSTAEVI